MSTGAGIVFVVRVVAETVVGVLLLLMLLLLVVVAELVVTGFAFVGVAVVRAGVGLCNFHILRD